MFTKEGISDFIFTFSMFVVSYSCADDAAHGKEYSIAAEADGVAHDIHVIVHAAT